MTRTRSHVPGRRRLDRSAELVARRRNDSRAVDFVRRAWARVVDRHGQHDVAIGCPAGGATAWSCPRPKARTAPASGRGAFDHGCHSTFCACSRNWSIAAFSARPMRVSAMSEDLEHSVLASRLNSCARKSSLRPTRLAGRDQRARFLRHARSAGRVPRAHRPSRPESATSCASRSSEHGPRPSRSCELRRAAGRATPRAVPRRAGRLVRQRCDLVDLRRSAHGRAWRLRCARALARASKA